MMDGKNLTNCKSESYHYENQLISETNLQFIIFVLPYNAQ